MPEPAHKDNKRTGTHRKGAIHTSPDIAVTGGGEWKKILNSGLGDNEVKEPFCIKRHLYL